MRRSYNTDAEREIHTPARTDSGNNKICDTTLIKTC